MGRAAVAYNAVRASAALTEPMARGVHSREPRRQAGSAQCTPVHTVC